MPAPKPQSGIEKIKLYTPGKSGAKGQVFRKLSSNENLYGPSPLAKDAVCKAAEDLWLYPSTDHSALRLAIAEVHGLDENRIICAGMGSDEILYALAQAYAGVGDEVIMTAHGFEVYGIATHAAGADLIVAEESARRVDVDAILAKISPRTKLIYIANPANPTGTMLDDAELARLAQSIPEDVLLVIDSAYAEFAAGYDGGAKHAVAQKNVVMTRTFSKLYGLGGLRVGWAFAHQDIIDTLNRIRIPFNLSNPALAGAEAAMRDQAYAQNCLQKITADRDDLRHALIELGLDVDKSFTNFLLVRFENAARARSAFEALAASGLIVRLVGHYGFDNALRITIGTSEDAQAVRKTLQEWSAK